MSSGVLAPIVIDNLWISDIQFCVLGEPAENMRLNVQEEHRMEDVVKDESGSYHLEGSLRVTADLVDEASPEKTSRPLSRRSSRLDVGSRSDRRKRGGSAALSGGKRHLHCLLSRSFLNYGPGRHDADSVFRPAGRSPLLNPRRGLERELQFF